MKSDYINFSVTPAMLAKYLRLVCKGKQVNKVDPVVENGDTLAYYVEFSNGSGWNHIAADTRVTPVLSESPTGHLVFEADNPVKGILGTLKNVVDVMMLHIWLGIKSIFIVQISHICIIPQKTSQAFIGK